MKKKPPVNHDAAATGRTRERKDICSYLRKQADKYREEGNPTVRLIIRELALEIEIGAHLRRG